MSNSPLVTVKLLSPNHSGARTHSIDTVTIHCFVSQVTAKRGCEVFLDRSIRASCNYVVGYDGSIGLCVEEGNRSWCTSSNSNDQRAITIEVASDTTYPYAITDKAYEALIELLVDICKRNCIKQLKWSTNKDERVKHLNGVNMTAHRDYANKSCPGEYIYEREGQIAEEVNNRLIGNKQKEEKINIYNKVADMPEYMRGTIIKLIDNGIIKGTGTGVKDENGRPADLNLTYDNARLLVIIDRAHEKGIW